MWRGHGPEDVLRQLLRKFPAQTLFVANKY